LDDETPEDEAPRGPIGGVQATLRDFDEVRAADEAAAKIQEAAEKEFRERTEKLKAKMQSEDRKRHSLNKE
jgi:hypothetical protein